MVNYNLNNKTISFEYFDVDNYEKRSSISSISNNFDTNQNNASEIKSICIDDNIIEYTEPYFPENNNISLLGTGGINGSDNREEVTNTSVIPYSPTGQVIAQYTFVYNNKTVTNFEYGTGFLEGPNVFATAAHCVFKDVTIDDYDDGINNPRFPDKLFFYPAKNGSNCPYTSNAIKININKEYYNNLDIDNDWAVVELENNIGNYTGWYGKISNWYTYGQEVKSYGYPYEKNGKMWSTIGNTKGITDYYYKTTLDISVGQSGSGVSVTYNNGEYMCGIITHYDENIFGTTTYTGATRINDFIFHYLNSYVASNIQWPVC